MRLDAIQLQMTLQSLVMKLYVMYEGTDSAQRRKKNWKKLVEHVEQCVHLTSHRVQLELFEIKVRYEATLLQSFVDARKAIAMIKIDVRNRKVAQRQGSQGTGTTSEL